MKYTNLVKFSKLGVLAFLVSCASSYRPETMEQTFNRISAREVESNLVNPSPVIEDRNVVTMLYHNYTQISENLNNQNSTNRSIASIPSKKKGATLFKDYSNKRIYFLTLLTQYYELKKLFKVDSPEITNCPKFHSSLLDNERQIGDRKNMEIQGDHKIVKGQDIDKINKNEMGYYPELFLSLNEKESNPKLINELSKSSDSEQKNISLTNQAFAVHIYKLKSEINQLCEDGYSRNYYIFENLTTHFESKASNDAVADLKILTKTSLFNNMLLKAALTDNFKIVSATNYLKEDNQLFNGFELESLKRLGPNWSQLYLNRVRRFENSYSKTQVYFVKVDFCHLHIYQH
ncbi:MAG: hypothetical protein U0T83_08270 [Bacteriovoracaceae bacterium]